MNRTLGTRDSWYPQTAEDRDAVLRALQAVVDSPYFCNSKRYPALLRYIVENALAGRADLLKERTLGIEVFDRPPTYDTNADTVVRYTAGEVRKRLQLYYSEHSSGNGIRISLPPGSYVPEFQLESELTDQQADTALRPTADEAMRSVTGVHEQPPDSGALALSLSLEGKTTDAAQSHFSSPQPSRVRLGMRMLWLSLAAAVVIAAIVGIGSKLRSSSPDRIVSEFWAPVLRNQHIVLVCTGGVVFQQNGFSGVITANKADDYPFVSMQAASAIALVSALIDHSGATIKLLPSPTTPISDLREHPVVLLGGYNNRWTMRLLQATRYQFTPEPVESIIDQQQPQVHWSRDRSRPYSSTDDYALIARYRDTATGDWVIVLAGLGRNGTEAAAQFTTSSNDLQMLQDQIGTSFSSGKSIEAVLKVRVIDGKTGAPSIEAVHVW